MVRNNTNSKTFEIIQTEDGSLSFYSHTYDENAHSLNGAFSETLYNFIEGCRLKERLINHSLKKPFSILEVGFGLGYGLLECLKLARNSNHFYKL